MNRISIVFDVEFLAHDEQVYVFPQKTYRNTEYLVVHSPMPPYSFGKPLVNTTLGGLNWLFLVLFSSIQQGGAEIICKFSTSGVDYFLWCNNLLMTKLITFKGGCPP